jgi:hypothetical protein
VSAGLAVALDAGVLADWVWSLGPGAAAGLARSAVRVRGAGVAAEVVAAASWVVAPAGWVAGAVLGVAEGVAGEDAADAAVAAASVAAVLVSAAAPLPVSLAGVSVLSPDRWAVLLWPSAGAVRATWSPSTLANAGGELPLPGGPVPVVEAPTECGLIACAVRTAPVRDGVMLPSCGSR